MSILPRSPTKKSNHQNHPTCTCPPAPWQALDVLGAHVLDRLDRDGEGDGGRQLPVVGDDLLRHRVAHLLIIRWKILTIFPIRNIMYIHVLHVQDIYYLDLIQANLPGGCKHSEAPARNGQQSNTSCKAQSCTQQRAPPSFPSLLGAPEFVRMWIIHAFKRNNVKLHFYCTA